MKMAILKHIKLKMVYKATLPDIAPYNVFNIMHPPHTQKRRKTKLQYYHWIKVVLDKYQKELLIILIIQEATMYYLKLSIK